MRAHAHSVNARALSACEHTVYTTVYVVVVVVPTNMYFLTLKIFTGKGNSVRCFSNIKSELLLGVHTQGKVL